ncbi:hypothetical protein ABL78_7810 [Leptomonas seymouri]|uniref:Uncharacterized protein n=1 Tax=Leptomonas seymouri TaxID=5684 RepID=A0A0N0P2N7_LEPSE|nr:hypothetical protein ABL78_7810 [Leptomonas seymouri]|eukprot:KPI83166.1 hypothetical protein ABL78_7810 [Leptomonas seymouri]
MGCGVSQSVLEGNDDLSKSDAFIHLCTSEKNPIAVQLNGYFNALVSECLYKSQGDMNGYERLLARRPTELTVNRSRRAAQRHGIGHKPLTVDGVNDIMNLFLGHVIKSLEKRKWSGTFNYTIMQPVSDIDMDGSSNANTDRPSTNSMSDSPRDWMNKKSFSNPTDSRKEKPPVKEATREGRSGDAATADSTADTTEMVLPNSLRSKKSALVAPSHTTGISSTLMFVDDGKGSYRHDDPNRQWRMNLTGTITYSSVDSALTLICDCSVEFLFFTCDTNLPPPTSCLKLKEDMTPQI